MTISTESTTEKVVVIILAAGQSRRFKSSRSKLLFPIAGKAMIQYVLDSVTGLNPSQIFMVVSPETESELRTLVGNPAVIFVTQPKALGTANAVQMVADKLKGYAGRVIITAGDMPFVTTETFRTLIANVADATVASLISVTMPQPAGYGRVVRDQNGHVTGVVEEKDATKDEREIREVNAGVYCVRWNWLTSLLGKIDANNRQKEYYLPDIVKLAREQGDAFVVYKASDPGEFWGINDRADMAVAEGAVRHKINTQWMKGGVSLSDPEHIYIDIGVKIGEDTTIGPQTALRGKTQLGRNCVIENGVVITDSTVADGVTIKSYSVLDNAVVGIGCVVGPFARLRPETHLEAGVRIGNFVELKKTRFKKGAKANHLSYLGDAVVGENVNIGCGTITCNYDGKGKYATTIEDDVFVGSDVAFVAPVTVGKGATIGAGSVITEDVPAGALAVARGRQVNKPGWKRGKN